MRGRGLGIVALLGGCQPNLGGIGSTTANTIGDDGLLDTSDGSTTAGPGPAMTDATETSGPVDDTAALDGGSSTGDGGGSMLTISDGPIYDYGRLAAGGQISHLFTVTNHGDVEAMGLDGSVPAPFTFAGGFPGTGTCGSSLTPSTSCTVEVSFAPTEIGLQAGTLAVSYDGGPDATRELAGDATGQSGNLLVNPGGETMGSPPPGWSNVGAGNWQAGDPWEGNPPPFAGLGYLLSYDGPSNQDYSLVQDVDVAGWATTIDAGVMRFSFLGHARTYAVGDDRYQLRVHYLDAGGAPLDTWDTGVVSLATWQLYSDLRAAPSGTRTIQVQLGCRKNGASYCDAYYDDLDLHAVHM